METMRARLMRSPAARSIPRASCPGPVPTLSGTRIHIIRYRRRVPGIKELRAFEFPADYHERPNDPEASMKTILAAFVLLVPQGKVLLADGLHTELIEYKQGDVVLEGYLARPKEARGKLPGVLICHQWMGLSDYEKGRAE